MKIYFVIDGHANGWGDGTETIFDSRESCLNYAKSTWDHLTASERKHGREVWACWAEVDKAEVDARIADEEEKYGDLGDEEKQAIWLDIAYEVGYNDFWTGSESGR